MNKLFLGVLTAASVCFFASGATGKVNVDKLNMRIGAGLETPVAGHLPQGAEVTILREVGNWLEIAAPASMKVYISEARVNPDGSLTGELNMRTAMSSSAPILGVLPKGAKVQRMDERKNGWVRIAPPKTIKVYVASFCVDYDKNAFPAAAAESKPAEAKTPEKAPEVKPAETKPATAAEKTEKVTMTGVLARWKYTGSDVSDAPTHALLDAPKGRCIGFVSASGAVKLEPWEEQRIRLTGTVVGRTAAGMPIIKAEEAVGAAEK